MEGWNHRVNAIIGRPHPRFQDLLKCMKGEVEKSELEIVRSEIQLEGIRRKTKYMPLDERIRRNTAKYDENGDVQKFLNVMINIISVE